MRNILINTKSKTRVEVSFEEKEVEITFNGCAYDKLEVISTIVSDIAKIPYYFKTEQVGNTLRIKDVCEDIIFSIISK